MLTTSNCTCLCTDPVLHCIHSSGLILLFHGCCFLYSSSKTLQLRTIFQYSCHKILPILWNNYSDQPSHLKPVLNRMNASHMSQQLPLFFSGLSCPQVSNQSEHNLENIGYSWGFISQSLGIPVGCPYEPMVIPQFHHKVALQVHN